MRWWSVVLTTIVCAIVVSGLWSAFWSAFQLMNNDELNLLVGLLGGVFGFWLSYTGRLARMFRKVG